MKKTIIILSAFIFCLNIAALCQKARVGITAGVASASMSQTIRGFDDDLDYRTGYMFGMQLEVPLCKKGNFSFQPDLRYIQKGGSDHPASPTINNNYVALRYAELAPNFVYNFKSGKGGAIYVGGGPYISFNLPSKRTFQAPGGQKVDNDILFGNEVAKDFRGVDYGVNAVMGIRIAKGFFVSANYIQGARNLVPDEKQEIPVSANDKIKNIAFALRIGWLFNTAAKK